MKPFDLTLEEIFMQVTQDPQEEATMLAVYLKDLSGYFRTFSGYVFMSVFADYQHLLYNRECFN